MTPSLLILTDFFRAANEALDYATNLAGPLGARLVLLHVRRDSLLDPELFTGELSDLSQEATALALSPVAGKLAVPVVAEIGHGHVAFAVADAVSRHHPLLVVLGRPDYSATPDEPVHTTALDILRTAPYPMLIVPHAVANTRHMSNSHHQLQATLAECLQAKLSGLNEKHARKLQKTIVKAAKKLVRKYARLEAKEQKGGKKASPVATSPAPKKAPLRAAKGAAPSATAQRPGKGARSSQKKVVPAKAAAA